VKGAATSQANAGSGVIYDAQGYILTNRHVIDSADAIEVTVPGGKIVAGTLVGQDPVADIAVVKIDPAAVSAVAAFGDSSLVRSGQRVVAIGSPLQFETSITRGIISGTDRSIGLIELAARLSAGLKLPPELPHSLDVALVANSPVWNLTVTPAALPRDARARTSELSELAGITGVPEEKLVADLFASDPYADVRVGVDLTQAQELALQERLPQLAGASVVQRSIRTYVDPLIFGHVLGYVGPLNEADVKRLKALGYRSGELVGKVGVEAGLETTLRGKNGWADVEVVRDAGGAPGCRAKLEARENFAGFLFIGSLRARSSARMVRRASHRWDPVRAAALP